MSTTEIILAIIGSGFGGWKIIELIINLTGSIKSKRIDIESKIIDSKAEEEKNFQERIIYKILDKYIEQNLWINNIFESKFEKLLNELNAAQKLSTDIYSQVDIFRRELRQYDKTLLVELELIKSKLK